MRFFEAPGNLDGELERLRQRQRIASQHLLQGAALQQLHHQIRLAVLLADIVDSADIRVVQRRRRARLAQKTLVRCLTGRTRAQIGFGEDFDRDLAVEACIARPVHHAHPATAQLFEHLVGPDYLLHAFNSKPDFRNTKSEVPPDMHSTYHDMQIGAGHFYTYG